LIHFYKRFADEELLLTGISVFLIINIEKGSLLYIIKEVNKTEAVTNSSCKIARTSLLSFYRFYQRIVRLSDF